MKFTERVKAMLGLKRSDSNSKPDPIRANVTIAVQRNERAGERAREALGEMLRRK